jgi:hypothetical protein
LLKLRCSAVRPDLAGLVWGFGLWSATKVCKAEQQSPLSRTKATRQGLNSPFGGSSPSLSIIITHTLKPVTVRTSQSQQPPPDPRGLCNWPSMRCSNAIARLSSHPTPPPRQLRRRRGVPTTLAAASFSLAVSQRGPRTEDPIGPTRGRRPRLCGAAIDAVSTRAGDAQHRAMHTLAHARRPEEPHPSACRYLSGGHWPGWRGEPVPRDTSVWGRQRWWVKGGREGHLTDASRSFDRTRRELDPGPARHQHARHTSMLSTLSPSVEPSR